jgi:hypothetical protein
VVPAARAAVPDGGDRLVRERVAQRRFVLNTGGGGRPRVTPGETRVNPGAVMSTTTEKRNKLCTLVLRNNGSGMYCRTRKMISAAVAE